MEMLFTRAPRSCVARAKLLMFLQVGDNDAATGKSVVARDVEHALRLALPGDKRGFCNFDHRIHSSGDYKNPPPREEHEGLRKYHEARSGDEIKLPVECRKIIADAIAKVLIEAGHQVWIVAVATNHVHFLAEVPIDLAAFQTLIATCKNKSSRAVDDLPGRIWGRGEDHVMVTSRSHRKNVYKYLRDKQAKDARHWKLDIKFSDDP